MIIKPPDHIQRIDALPCQMCHERLATVVVEFKDPSGKSLECFRLCDECHRPLQKFA